jgi:hypothetical protein
MHLNRQIILLFFLSSIVNRQAIVKASSIVKQSSIVKAWRVQGSKGQGSSGPKVQRSKGPRVQGSKGQARDQDQEPTAGPDKPGGSMREPGTTTGTGPKGIYISHAAATLKINKKNLRVKVAIGRGRRIFVSTNNPNP